jgi:uncharacterized protein YcbX
MKLDHFGPELDRRWMLVDDNGRFISQREQATMALISITLKDGGINVTVPGQGALFISRESSTQGDTCQVSVWSDTVAAIDGGDSAADYFSRFLNKSCRLVFMPEQVKRQVDTNYASNGELVSFADGFPLLLISEASLNDLNRQLTKPVDMRRFRPNIVVKGCEAFAEDHWKSITMGDLQLDIVKPCSRCVIPSIDPDTASKDSEVLKALARTRRINSANNDHAVYFGQNVLHRQQGVISVGDTLIAAE